MTNTEDEKKELLSKSELSIWLDHYDDIFSDFDSRPYETRSLSDDFLNEAKKMAREQSGGKIELKLLMPAAQRNPETESVVIKSLHSHFRHFIHAIETEMKHARVKGYNLATAGILTMTISAIIINITQTNIYLNTLRVILEPAGWFLVWTGLDHILYVSKGKHSELDFNSKMAHSEITFLSF
jgi:hypothetical protein